MPYGVYLLFLFSSFNYLVYIYSTILIIIKRVLGAIYSESGLNLRFCHLYSGHSSPFCGCSETMMTMMINKP